MNLKEELENCKQGHHTYARIERITDADETSHVMRWCGVCGILTEHQDVDGRIMSPRWQTPKIVKLAE
jgi:hypothetical protein